MKSFDQCKGKALMVDLHETYNEVEHGIGCTENY